MRNLKLVGGLSMSVNFTDMFSVRELSALSSIIQVGDSAYRDFLETQQFGHRYLSDIRGRIRTKFVQMQCEIESHDPKFPFEFFQREFQYNQIIPELRNKNVILHIARSTSPDCLPRASKYKVSLSNNNNALQRQMIIEPDSIPPYGDEPFYALLVFGGSSETFSAIQFPEPGYHGIVETLPLPQISLFNESETTEVFERKKAALKKEFLVHDVEAAIS